MKWKILDTGKRCATENMAIDTRLLKEMKSHDPPILHFYDWEGKAATYGYFIDPNKLLDLGKAKDLHLSLARRPTGGGIIFHVTDFAFSALVPANFPHYSINTLDNYDFINGAVKRGLSPLLTDHTLTLLHQNPLSLVETSSSHFCMAKPTQYDVMLEGRKIAGAAQRRHKQGYLHQGSITIALPEKYFLHQLLIEKEAVYAAMYHHTFPLLQRDWTQRDLDEIRAILKQQLQKEITR